MIQFLASIDLFDIPVSSPELKFFIILGIVLFTPLLLDRLHIPHILGLIIAGALIGENGFNLLERDSGIVMSGSVGLLYIMFLAGLEIDMNEFVKNRWRSIVFGLYTFVIPMVLGTLTGLYLLNFSLMTSVLLASMFASHTLLAYPIISKMGVKRNRAVTVAIGGTVIAETLALLVLAVVVGMTEGEVNTMFWVTMSVKLVALVVAIFYLFPIVARYFLRQFSDAMTQYIFVLFMLFLGTILAYAAGIEGIIGALFTGLALNRLIPNTSALMNRIEFVGNAIFIPFFLIGVGMLIDYRVFLSDPNTLYTAFVMTVVAIFVKYIASYLTQKSFGYNEAERSVIFGLSAARAAATLAVVLVGYNVILGHTPEGEPIRLFSATVLNGTIVMIFITCSVASIAAQRGAYKLSMSEAIDLEEEHEDGVEDKPMVLIPFHSAEGVSHVMSFANLMLSRSCNITVANIICDGRDEAKQVAQSRKLFDEAKRCAASIDRVISTMQRYDMSFTNGVLNIVRENKVSDIILNLDMNQEGAHKMISKVVDNALYASSTTVFMYRSVQSIETIGRRIIVIPPHAEQEIGFRAWIIRMWTLMRKSEAQVKIYATSETIKVVEQVNKAVPQPIEYVAFERYSDLLIISRELRRDDGLIFVMARNPEVSYDETMEQIPYYINNYFSQNNVLLIYPFHSRSMQGDLEGMTNTASINVVERVEDVIESVIKVVKRGGR